MIGMSAWLRLISVLRWVRSDLRDSFGDEAMEGGLIVGSNASFLPVPFKAELGRARPVSLVIVPAVLLRENLGRRKVDCHLGGGM